MIIEHKSPYGDAKYRLIVNVSKYKNGQSAIQLYDAEDGLPYAKATVSVQEQLEDGEVAIKNYSENSGILESLVSAGVVTEPHRFIYSGFVTIPVCKLKLKSK
jgi:hypothetical protein